jgi:Tfp pilus assembly protein FimT
MRSGFTLIELMVSVGILMVISISTMVVLNNFTSKQKLEEATEELVSNLRLARNYAMTSQKPAGYGGNITFVSVAIDATGKTTIIPNGAGVIYYFDKPLSVKDVTVGVTGSIAFSAFEGKLMTGGVLVSPATSVTLTVSTSGISDTKTITINYLGQINAN